MKLERRFIPITEIEVRQAEEGQRKISGYAAVFNRMSENLGGFREIILPGAFRSVLESKPDVKCLFNHDPGQVLARTKNDTLTIEEDEHGLKFEAILADTTAARDVWELIQRGDVDQCSFAFSVAKNGDKWIEEDDMYKREIYQVEMLADVSPVTYPAYSQTSVNVRSAGEVLALHLEDLRAQEAEVLHNRAQARRKRELELQKSMIGGNK
jgi:HK97 family phage prohead protease